MLLISIFILCLTKASKVRKIHCFFLKNWVSLFILDFLFFSHKLAPKKNCMTMYLRCPTLIQKQVSKNILFFAVDITFFIANVSDFTRILLIKIKNCPWWLGWMVKACASQAQGLVFKSWCRQVYLILLCSTVYPV